jgi:hypothetical protein
MRGVSLGHSGLSNRLRGALQARPKGFIFNKLLWTQACTIDPELMVVTLKTWSL